MQSKYIRFWDILLANASSYVMPRQTYTYRTKALTAALIQARKTAGMTQVEVAKKLKRPQSFVSKYESGERRLDVVEFLEVVEALGTDECEILQRIK